MRILQVLHFFLPRHYAGTEVYTDSLARSLKQRGHDVHLMFSEKILSQPNYSLVRREHEGLPCHVVVNNLLYESFEETFSNEPVERIFREVLDEVRPDLVHFQHLMLLSLRLPEIARSRGIRTVMTLHDFWLYCARFGQLQEHGGKVCDGPEPKKCASCIVDFKFAQTPLQKKMISAIRWTREVAGFDLAPVVEAWRKSKWADVTRRLPRLKRGAPDRMDRMDRTDRPNRIESIEDECRMRESVVAEMLPSVDLFLSPSLTVRDRMVRFGLPREKIQVLPLGIQGMRVGPRRPLEGRAPVFGFIGTLAPHKGVHVLIEAMRHMKGEASLIIYGGHDYYPRYVNSLKAEVQELPIRFAGSVPRSEIGAAFASIDVLVMPSVWLENFPIIIQEAHLAGVPVVASNLGGMAEAIEDGVDGLLFEVDDPIDLARQLDLLVAEPRRIAQMAERAELPISVEEHAARVEQTLLQIVAGAPEWGPA